MTRSNDQGRAKNQEAPLSWHSLEVANPVLQQASKLLDCSKDKLKIFDVPVLSHLFDKKRADRPIAAIGFPGLPLVTNCGLHTYTNYRYGITLFETRTDPSIPYVIANFQDDKGYHKDFLVAKDGDIFRLYRYFKRCEQNKNIKNAPVLEPGLMEELLKQTIHFLIASDEIEKYGVRVRRGVLLHGSPGNGKTMACQWIRKLCDDHNIKWRRITAGQILHAFGKSELDELVTDADIVFFDDIDMSFLCRRNSESATISCALLAALDGINTTSHVIRIFTTNEIVETIDEAFLRPGRIDRVFLFNKPTHEMRQQLIEQWPKEITESVGIDNIVRETTGFSFAETEAIRSLLVTRFLFDGNVWDLDRTMKDYKAYTGTKEVRSPGFVSE